MLIQRCKSKAHPETKSNHAVRLLSIPFQFSSIRPIQPSALSPRTRSQHIRMVDLVKIPLRLHTSHRLRGTRLVRRAAPVAEKRGVWAQVRIHWVFKVAATSAPRGCRVHRGSAGTLVLTTCPKWRRDGVVFVDWIRGQYPFRWTLLQWADSGRQIFGLGLRLDIVL